MGREQGAAVLREIDLVRMRIKGSAFYVTDAERRRCGGLEYLLIRVLKERYHA